MKVTDADLRQALGHRRPRGSDREGCPSTEAIVAHAEGPHERPSEVLDHVSQCDACAVEYRLALALKPWAAGAASALGDTPPAVAPVRARSAWWPQALAASLLVGVGLTAWNVTLRGQRLDLQAQLAEAESRAAAARLAVTPSDAAATSPAPAVNVPIVDLDAGGSRGAAGAPVVVRVAPGTPLVTFVLAVSGGAPAGEHHLEIRREDARVVWEGGGLMANAFGTFTLAVPAALLPAGRYEFVLWRPTTEKTTRPVQTYRVVVQPPEP